MITNSSEEDDEDELEELELDEDEDEGGSSSPPSAVAPTSSGPMMSANISAGKGGLLVFGTPVGTPVTAGAGLC